MFDEELVVIDLSTSKLVEICCQHQELGISKKFYVSTIAQIELHITEIEHMNEILDHQNEGRTFCE